MTIPRCPYFNQCGGCTAQHIDYTTQVESKKKTLAASINYQDITVLAANEYNYRNRMDFIFHPGGIGLRRRGDWKAIVDITACAISDQKINTLITEVRAHFINTDVFDMRKQTGTYKYAVLRVASTSTAVSFVLNKKSTRLAAAIEQIKEFSQKTTADNVVVTYVDAKTDNSISDDFFVIKGNDMLQEIYLGKRFWYSVQGFFQNNHRMAEELQQYVRSLLQKHHTADAHLLDLYAGVGTFGIINADLFKEVTIVESVEPCIDAAKKNILENSITNATAHVLDAKQIKKLSFPSPLVAITDPPRSGMDPKAIEQLCALAPELIIYISCNINQLARELPKFKDYTIKSAAMADLFPQTNHAEAVVELVRKT